MPHADSSLIPSSITTKVDFWQHVYSQLEALLEGQRNWVSNLSNASSLIFNALAAFPSHFGTEEKAVNWCGFYLHESQLPLPRFGTKHPPPTRDTQLLLLGPFCGKPACQFITVSPPRKARGVCADAHNQHQTLIVEDVESYPGHIACDGETQSEIVCPMVLKTESGEDVHLGVLDLDCVGQKGFGEEDREGLERIVRLIVEGCDW
ncbi:GAF domain-like protein [Pterulicium gracile]|uniref:GAF domain-like protein n=1 Tax=Pterulicium gracile TaxID=1884261 RepID=A0A5C3QNA2_9AGAR|nr:GAF domain-like protein [Pterula gracilis]